MEHFKLRKNTRLDFRNYQDLHEETIWANLEAYSVMPRISPDFVRCLETVSSHAQDFTSLCAMTGGNFKSAQDFPPDPT